VQGIEKGAREGGDGEGGDAVACWVRGWQNIAMKLLKIISCIAKVKGLGRKKNVLAHEPCRFEKSK
jgi:hypothetical protein